MANQGQIIGLAQFVSPADRMNVAAQANKSLVLKSIYHHILVWLFEFDPYADQTFIPHRKKNGLSVKFVRVSL